LNYCKKFYPDATEINAIAVTEILKPFATAGCEEVAPHPGSAQYACCAPQGGDPNAGLCKETGGQWANGKCACPDGYSWNDKAGCVKDADPNEALCAETGGFWSGKKCDCPGGYSWDAKAGCVKDTDPNQILCEDTGGFWSGKNCECLKGMIWDADLGCVEEVDPNEGLCKETGGQWANGACACPDGMSWNDALGCIKDVQPDVCKEGLELVGEFAIWCGKVNVHTNPLTGVWEVDGDCKSGCNDKGLNYCKKFYPSASQVVKIDVSPDKKPFATAGCADQAPHPGKDQYACCAPAEEPAAPTYAKDVQPIFKKYCGNCHGNSGQGFNAAGSYDSTQLDSYYCKNMTKGACAVVRIKEGSMPPFGKVSDEDLNTLDEWVKGGQLK